MALTLRRRLLGLLPVLGVNVLEVGPGAVVLTRGADVQTSDVGDGAVLVTRAAAGGARMKLGRNYQLVGPRAANARQRAERDKAVSDWLLAQHLRDVLRRYRVDCVLDVGANRGQYVRLVRRAGFRGRIVSFEPVPELFAQLSAAAANDELWDVHQVALGRENGELQMHVVPGSLSSLLPPSEFGSARYERLRATTSVTVPVRRLDEVLAQIGESRMLLKLDTQGFDLEAFAGATGVLDRIVALQSEVALLTIYDGMPRLPEALATYEAAGFEVTGLYPVSRESRTQRVLEYDCVMVRADTL